MFDRALSQPASFYAAFETRRYPFAEVTLLLLTSLNDFLFSYNIGKDSARPIHHRIACSVYPS